MRTENGVLSRGNVSERISCRGRAVLEDCYVTQDRELAIDCQFGLEV